MTIKDRINNCKLILKDIELNCTQGHTREPFKDLDDQCEYLEESIEYLLRQINIINIRSDI